MLTTRFSTRVPASLVNTVRRELDEAFNHVFASRAGQLEHATPGLPLTVWSDDARIYVQADVPGVSRDKLDVDYKDGQLCIRGERHVASEDGRYWHNERIFGQFERLIAVSDAIDPASIEAQLSDGVLTITMSKKLEAQPQKIEIKASSAGNDARLTDEAQDS